MITTTLRKVLALEIQTKKAPSGKHEEWAVKNIRDFYTKAELDEEFPLSDLIATNSMLAAFCIIKHYMSDEPGIVNLSRKFAVWCAYKSADLLGDANRATLDMVWLHSEGRATDEDLDYSVNLSRYEFKAAHKDLHNNFNRPIYDTCKARKVYFAACAAEATTVRYPNALAADYSARATSTHPLGYNPAVEKEQAAKLKKILDAGKWVED